MTFHLIVTCVAQKKATDSHSILDSNIKSGSLEEVFEQWANTLQDSSLKKIKAIDLYSGGLWGVFLDSWGVINGRVKDAKLWVLSAGYGLISSEKKIVPYNITFQEPKSDTPSILKKISYPSTSNAKIKILQGWWHLLSESKNSLEYLLSEFAEGDRALVVLSKDYLDAVFQDLFEGIKKSKFPNNIAVICNNVNDTVAKRLNSNWLFANNNFVNLPRTNNTFVNGKIAHQLLLEMFENQSGIDWWSNDNFNAFLKSLGKTLPKPEKIHRRPSTDDEVKNFIKEHLVKSSVSFTKLHRSYRDSGSACEYTRFKDLYAGVQEDIKKQILRKRPQFPVVHTPRKTKMLFFLPDWDDRVDPLFNFDIDEAFPNRDPYEHDVYHYEIYGHLNCDGILISRSVLEENKNKIKKITQIGIHKYLRLPSNVPVLADCGAFNYITQENPPYKTDEILDFYQNLGFNYGVSIDHLIVPGILKKRKYHRLTKNGKWEEINKEVFNKLKVDLNTKVVKSLTLSNQLNFFDFKNMIFEGTYIDVDERSRRYNLTTKNAEDFFRGYRDGKYSFTPIGAAQGWDPQSYAKSVQAYQDIGYEYIALGGLARSNNKEILAVLYEVNKIRNKNIKLHIFGVARIDVIEKFLEYGVASADSAGMLRQAWLSSANNYYSNGGDHYTAIRIPLTENKKTVKKAIIEHGVTFDALVELEKKCLKTLKEFDDGKIKLDVVMNVLMSYHRLMGGDNKLEPSYQRTLLDSPWKKCQCKICKTNGIQIAIFRRNNRNRRRGFHNTWLFFNRFKGLTNIA